MIDRSLINICAATQGAIASVVAYKTLSIFMDIPFIFHALIYSYDGAREGSITFECWGMPRLMIGIIMDRL